MPCDFPVERPKKRQRRCDEGREEDECLDDKARCKVETFIAVADAVNQQNCRFAEQQVAFMAQLWHFIPRSLLEGEKDLKTGDVADSCEMYGADADEVCRKLSDFKLVYRLSGLELSSELPAHEKETASVEKCDDPQYKEPAGEDDSSDDEDREDMPVDSQQNTFVKQWKSRTSLKPYRVLIVWLSEFDNALLHLLLPASIQRINRAAK